MLQKRFATADSCVRPVSTSSVSPRTVMSGPLKMCVSRTCDSTPPAGTTGLSCVSSRQTRSPTVSFPRSSGKPGSPTSIGHGRVPDVRADAHIAVRAEVHAGVQADPRHPLLVARDDCVVVNQVERHASNARVRRDEQRRRPNRAIELDSEARIRSDRAVDSQLRARSDGVKRQIAGRRRDAEVARGRVLQVDAQHHERRRIGLDASLHE